MKKDIARLLLKVKAVSLRPNKPYKFASGILSPIYCDNRLLISHPKEREVIIDSFIKIIRQKKIVFDVIAGTATAGIPWAAFLALKLDKPMIYARKESKGHGKENTIEGKLDKGDRVLLIEDLVSTGGSSLNAVKSIRDAGGKIAICLAIFSYNFLSAESNFRQEKVNLITLISLNELIDIAVKDKYIKSKDKKLLFKWNKNPEKWQR